MVHGSIKNFALTHFGGLWRGLQSLPPVNKLLNRALTDSAIYTMPTRPHALSTLCDYTSWDSLSDRTWSDRHLPPADRPAGDLPPAAEVANLFRRPASGMRAAEKSSVLFSYFAQWFTDGFLRTDLDNFLKNTSTHEIDLANLYGLCREQTLLLRSLRGGKLKSQAINGEEYPPFYYGEDGRPREEFVGLSMTKLNPMFSRRLHREVLDRSMFAVGGDRVNAQVGFVALNTLFLREHNRLCDVLRQAEGISDDERLFQTARNILIVMLMKIVVEEYINHITPYHFQFRVFPGNFEASRWYRRNWMAIEFTLLYRWHELVPDTYSIGGRDYTVAETLFNNKLVTDRGLGGVLEDASLQPAGEIGLFNTPDVLMYIEEMSVETGRQARLPSYNDYREACKFGRVRSFEDVSSRADVRDALKSVYKSVDKVEFYPGLFAEDVRHDSALPPMIGRFVGVDAFSQAYTNPLLAAHIFNARTFTPTGLKIIEETGSLSQIVHRNIPAGSRHYTITMDRQPTREGAGGFGGAMASRPGAPAPTAGGH